MHVRAHTRTSPWMLVPSVLCHLFKFNFKHKQEYRHTEQAYSRVSIR